MVETTSGLPSFPAPQGGASLLLSFRLERKTVVVVGANMLAASRAFAALEANAKVVVLCPKGREGACEELQWRAGQGQVTIVDPLLTSSTSSSNPESAVLEHMLSDPHTQVHLVCVTDTVLGEGRRSRQSAADLAKICRSYRVPVNVTDEPTLCDFSFTATHRFVDATSGEHTPLQVGVTTNGQGCRLAGRVRREIVARLPKTVGGATLGVSRLREMTKHGANDEGQRLDAEAEEGEDSTTPTPNKPVTQRQLNDVETPAEQIRRQMRWVAQVSEYWPLGQLASMNNADAAKVLTGGFDSPPTTKHRPPLAHASDTEFSSLHSLAMTSPAASPRKGRIFLVGSGPGHPSLLTRATHTALTELADLVLSDKLVPSAVLELIPPSVKVQIARKFPGNAEGAQTEMMEAAVEAANRGLTVVRLKQGDPTVYGRAGEEVIHFRKHGFESIVVPGVTSALAGPIFAGIPVTQRGVAESVIICTGVGRAGKEIRLPGYERARTLVVLMGVARLGALLDALCTPEVDVSGRRAGEPYPLHLPIAIIERASMPDQRAVVSTLEHVVAAMDSVGEQRPPGMIVVGWSVLALAREGDMTILDTPGQELDGTRVRRWLGGQRWRVTEGFHDAWDVL